MTTPVIERGPYYLDVRIAGTEYSYLSSLDWVVENPVGTNYTIQSEAGKYLGVLENGDIGTSDEAYAWDITWVENDGPWVIKVISGYPPGAVTAVVTTTGGLSLSMEDFTVSDNQLWYFRPRKVTATKSG